MPTEELNKVLLSEVRRGRHTYLECLISLGAQITSPVREHAKQLVTGAPYTKFYTYLHVAAHNGDVGMLETLLSYGVDPYHGTRAFTLVANSDLLGGEGRLPLDVAAQGGHVEIVRALITWEEAGDMEDLELSPLASSPSTPPPSVSTLAQFPFPPDFVDSIIHLGRKVDNHRTLLFAVIEEGGSLELIRALVRMGEPLDAVQRGGFQPLHYAVSLGKVGIVRELLKLGASMSTCRENWNTCYHIAVEMGLVDVLKVIAEHDPHSVNVPNRVGEIPLHVAARLGNLEVMKTLLNCGGDTALNNEAYGGVTAVQCAVELNKLEVVRELANRGASLEHTSHSGETPLLLATRKNHTSIALYLIGKASETIRRYDKCGNTPLHNAARRGNLDVVKELVDNNAEVDAQSDDWSTPLLLAAHCGHTEVVKFLLERKAGIEVKAMYDHRTPLIEAVISEKIDTVALLLDSGAQVNVKDCHTGSSLYYAVMRGNIPITKMLLDHGATPNEADNSLLAVAVDHGVEMLKLLLKYNAKPTSQALVVAIEKRKEDEAVLLLDEGASCCVDDYISTPGLQLAICHEVVSVAKKLIEKGETVQPETLHLAVHTTSTRMVELLLEHVKVDFVEYLKGAANFDFALPSEFKRSLGSCRCGCCSALHCSADLGSLGITQILVEKGFNINAKNSNGETPLHVAIRMRKVAVAQYLIEQGANLGMADSLGMTPLLCALLPYHQSHATPEPLAPQPPSFASLASIIKQLVLRRVDPDAKLPLAYPLPHAPPLLFPIPPSPDFLPPLSILRTSISPDTFTGNSLEHVLWNRWTACQTLVMDWDGLWELLGGNERHRGANKDTRSTNGDTLLHQAVMMLDTKVVELLVRADFDVNAVNSEGKTPLSLCAEFVGRCQARNYLVDLVTSEADKIKMLLSKQVVLFHCEWPTIIFKHSVPSTPHADMAGVTMVANRPKITVRKRRV